MFSPYCDTCISTFDSKKRKIIIIKRLKIKEFHPDDSLSSLMLRSYYSGLRNFIQPSRLHFKLFLKIIFQTWLSHHLTLFFYNLNIIFFSKKKSIFIGEYFFLYNIPFFFFIPMEKHKTVHIVL